MENTIMNDTQGIDDTCLDETSDQVYYKYNSPMHPTEVDWTITLSRNDFPWMEIRFGEFSSKDYFEKYSSVVKDS